MNDEIAIIGLGETPVGKLPGYGSTQLQAWAALNAIKDAGLKLSDIDGLLNQDPYSIPHSMYSLALAEYLGIRPTYSATCNVGGTVTPMVMLQQASDALAEGQCRYCLIVQGENMATSRPAGSVGHVLHNHQGGDEFKEPFGVQGAPIAYALVAQRYRHETGATERDFGAVAVQARENAMLNPNRQTKNRISIEEYLASPFVSEPLRRLDCSLVSDGAGALLATTKKQAQKLGVPYATVSSFAMQATHCGIPCQPDLDQLALPAVAGRAFAQAGMGPDDMDVLLIHDAFSFSVLLQLEGLGFCKPGDAGRFVREGNTAVGGRWPVNPHGGLLAQAHFGGMLHPVEAFRQLRGGAGDRQVPNARTALWCGNGGVFSVFGVMILTGGGHA